MRLQLLLALSSIFLGSTVAQAQVPLVTTGSPVVQYVTSPTERVVVTDETGRRWETANSSRRDLDDDGVVETATVVRPAGSNAPVGGLDRVIFVGPSGPTEPKILAITPEVARQSAVGTINQINIVPVNGVDTLFVRVNTSVNGPGTYADLGPVSTWPGGTIQLKKVVSVSGPVVKQGERSVIIAERAALNAQPEFPIIRPVVFVRQM